MLEGARDESTSDSGSNNEGAYTGGVPDSDFEDFGPALGAVNMNSQDEDGDYSAAVSDKGRDNEDAHDDVDDEEMGDDDDEDDDDSDVPMPPSRRRVAFKGPSYVDVSSDDNFVGLSDNDEIQEITPPLLKNQTQKVKGLPAAHRPPLIQAAQPKPQSQRRMPTIKKEPHTQSRSKPTQETIIIDDSSPVKGPCRKLKGRELSERQQSSETAAWIRANWTEKGNRDWIEKASTIEEDRKRYMMMKKALDRWSTSGKRIPDSTCSAVAFSPALLNSFCLQMRLPILRDLKSLNTTFRKHSAAQRIVQCGTTPASSF